MATPPSSPSLSSPTTRPRNISPTTLIVAITLFIFSSCSLTNSFYRYVTTRLSANEWDVLIFTQNWPVSVCLSWEHKHKGNACLQVKSSNSWTIHGIWPTKLGTMGPFFCNTSRPFNPEAIYGIENELNEKWAPIQKHKNKYMFWRHEWEKHGTCAAELSPLSTEFDYFYQGLEWHKQYNLSAILSKTGIIPGRGYNISTIWLGVRAIVGKSPHIACFTDPVTKSSYILEIRLCFNKTLALVDCDGTKIRIGSKWNYGEDGYTDCNVDKIVEYPLASPYPPPARRQKQEHYIFDVLKFLQLVSWITS